MLTILLTIHKKIAEKNLYQFPFKIKMLYPARLNSLSKASLKKIGFYFFAGASDSIYLTIFLASTCVILG